MQDKHDLQKSHTTFARIVQQPPESDWGGNSTVKNIIEFVIKEKQTPYANKKVFTNKKQR